MPSEFLPLSFQNIFDTLIRSYAELYATEHIKYIKTEYFSVLIKNSKITQLWAVPYNTSMK
jgi:hypothetical protein